MEPDVVSNQPKINRNTFKIGSGDLQQEVANNTKRIRVISTMLRSNRRRSADGLSPQATNIQQSLEQSNLILADIAVQLEADFQDRENRERRLLLRNRQEKLELRRRNIEKDIEYKKTEKKITKSNNKIKGPLAGLCGAIGKILLLSFVKIIPLPSSYNRFCISIFNTSCIACLFSLFKFILILFLFTYSYIHILCLHGRT